MALNGRFFKRTHWLTIPNQKNGLRIMVLWTRKFNIFVLNQLLIDLSSQPTKHLAPNRPVREAYMALPIPFRRPPFPPARPFYGFLYAALWAMSGRCFPEPLSGFPGYRICRQAAVMTANRAAEAYCRCFFDGK